MEALDHSAIEIIQGRRCYGEKNTGRPADELKFLPQPPSAIFPDANFAARVGSLDSM